MPATWKQDNLFPIIAQIIRDAYVKQPRFITHDKITAALLADPTASGIIADAYKENDEKRSLEWLAHNMVAWFSQKITAEQSEWSTAFDRQEIDCKWAYKPKDD